MFSLNYQLMTQTLQRMHYTGLAKAIIPSGPFAGGTLLLQVRGGTILASTVAMSDGMQVTDAQLIAERLLPIAMLEWDLIANPTSLSPVSEAPTQPVSTPSLSPVPPIPPTPAMLPSSMPVEPSPPASSVDTETLSPYSYPRRAPVDPAWMSTWPFVYRQVYNLSTGHYSEQDIGRLLRYPWAELVKVFNDLQRMKIIQRRT